MIVKLPLPEGVTEAEEMHLKFNNGDLEAINSVMDKYRFVDEQAMIRFALVVLLKADRNGVYVDRGEDRVFVTPSEEVIIQTGLNQE